MSFDKPTRNLLASLVGDCRRLLTADIRDQLQRVYGLQPDGTALPLENLHHLDEQGQEIARELRIWQDHLTSTEHGTDQKRRIAAFDRLAQETAFTSLNRLAALHLCEERGHILECVRRGMESDGFALYEQLSGGALGARGETYRQFLQRVFDELAQDLGALFDRRQPQSLVFPGERCLEDVLALLNDPALRHLWQEDETIGWIYQYYNSQEERRRMREESAAPRNSHELAVRNQFFTPRYVVEFLTDNTLGRIWYEMTKGATSLKEKCRYLVRRPNEIFLSEGQDATAPSTQDQTPNKTQEELLKEPVHILHRSLKDPREIRLLDPACGSMHFGLYAFDLLETIYEEAWDHHPELLVDLRRTVTDKREFLILVPKLIIEHNLHGIEIDPRCTQIAGLSLWLRAQKTWQRLGLRLAERPRIARSNIVCAEPMPGEKELLREFTARLESPAIGQLVEMVFDKMRLAGEAGSLLKIEEEIKTIVAQAKTLWKQRPRYEQAKLFDDHPAKPEQQELKLDLSGITDDQFWERAEERIYTTLREYAEQVQNGSGYQRRLFTEDAAQGFAFIDLCSKQYDAILMNPPYGEFPESLGSFAADWYSLSKSDIGLSMVSRGLELTLPGGLVGALTSRLFIVNDTLRDWRLRELLSEKSLDCLLDLGYGVLDGAMVEVAAYVVDNKSKPTDSGVSFMQVLDERDKESAASAYFLGETSGRTFSFTVSYRSFLRLKGHLLCYWLPQELLTILSEGKSLNDIGAAAHFGASTSDDFQFVRLWWEVPEQGIKSKFWVPFAKGGEYSPLIDDVSLLLEWDRDGKRLKSYVGRKAFETQGSGGWTRWINGIEFYFAEGLTFPERTTSDFCPQILPRGCIFSAIGSAIHFKIPAEALQFLGLAFTRVFKVLADAVVGTGDSSVSGSAARHYRPGIVNGMPVLLAEIDSALIASIREWLWLRRIDFEEDELSSQFVGPQCDRNSRTLALWSHNREINRLARCADMIELNSVIEERVFYHLKMSSEGKAILDVVFGPHPASYPKEVANVPADSLRAIWKLDDSSIIEQTVAAKGARRQLTKKSYVADRHLELVSHSTQLNPQIIVQFLKEEKFTPSHTLQKAVADFVSHCIGCVYGRWDIQHTAGERVVRESADPFEQVPVCSPGMLQNAEGLPARHADVSRTYPLQVSWSGAMVDDPEHREDIERRVREAIEVIWKDRVESIEHETCEILGVRSMREYFRKPSGFFADHLKRYSKSRRQAPIYWPLSTASGSYTVWIYYHRLNDDFLYKVVNDYVSPKIVEVERHLAQVEADLPRASGREATKLREAFEETKSFLFELQDFKAELLRVAALPYRPNLNDGVLITAAPLWKLFRLPKWRNDLKECWEQLEAEDYDWAHLAYSIWPERVREKCKNDRSLAIAHGLEALCETKPPEERSGSRRKRKARAAMPTES